MALQTIKGGVIVPDYGRAWSDGAWATMVIDAAGEKATFIIPVPKTGTISKVGFATRAVADSQTLRVGLETLDASGNPSGTQYGGSVVGTQAAPAANTYYTVTLGTGASATRGDLIAVVIQFDVTVGNVQIGYHNTNIGQAIHVPYLDLFTTVWTKNASHAGPITHLEYSDASVEVIPQCYPWSGSDWIAAAFNNGSTPDERALRFTLPNQTRAAGFWVQMDRDGDADVVLYDSDSTALQTTSLPAVRRGGTSYGHHTAFFPASQVLSANTVYRLAVKPTTVTNVTLYEFTVAAALIMDAFAIGQNAYLSTRALAGAWTDTTTRRSLVGLILDQL